MTFKLATWNINSVRLRISLVERFLQEHQPDVLCLQEIKCTDEQFPEQAFRDLGYDYIAVHGQKAYHGVATVSRLPLTEPLRQGFCGKDDARHVSVDLDIAGGLRLHNFYVPSGGDEPDPEKNEKFAHKLSFLEEMERWYRDEEHRSRMILVGDLNVAPLEHDVWSHKQMLKVVSHTPVEVEHLNAVQSSLQWVDVMRKIVPGEEKLYSWWSYRAKDWEASNRGRRLDHIWVTPELGDSASAMQVVKDARRWEKTSDHAPVIADFEI